MHDMSMLVLKKLERDYDPTSRMAALQMLEETCCAQVLVTGLIYFNKDQPPLPEVEDMVETPLAHLQEDALRPSEESLAQIMEELR